MESVKVSSRICTILGAEPPDGFSYELFLDQNGERISKTKGNGLSIEEWLRYGVPESLSYYIFNSPRSAKKLYFDVIPRASDEYLRQLDAFQEDRADADNPVWHVHEGNPPEMGSPVSFSLLLNLVSAADAHSKEILWSYLARYLPGATPQTEPMLDRMAGLAVNYYEDFVAPYKQFRAPSSRERAALEVLLHRLQSFPERHTDAKAIQNETYAAGKEAGIEPLRNWFRALYEILLGQSQGPRFGTFAAVFGLRETCALIERALSQTPGIDEDAH